MLLGSTKNPYPTKKGVYRLKTYSSQNTNSLLTIKFNI